MKRIRLADLMIIENEVNQHICRIPNAKRLASDRAQLVHIRDQIRHLPDYIPPADADPLFFIRSRTTTRGYNATKGIEYIYITDGFTETPDFIKLNNQRIRKDTIIAIVYSK